MSLEAFEHGCIEPGGFDHEAHVRVAWSYLKRYELPEAIDRFSDALRRLTVKLGVESKYHETVTWFFMILIAERISTPGSDDWQAFKRRHPDLPVSGPAIIRR